MRASLLFIALILIPVAGLFVWLNRDRRVVSAAEFVFLPSSGPAPKQNFDTEIKPIFQARCQPCHFQGGQVYEKLPFDKPGTITRLGTKLFTRIKDEKERHVIQEFLDASNSQNRK